MNVVRLCMVIMVSAFVGWLSTETAVAETNDEATPTDQSSTLRVHTVLTFADGHDLPEVEAALQRLGRPYSN